MPDQVHLFIVQSFDQANDISHKGIHTIRFYTLWFITHVVTALVRGDDSTTRSCQGRNLFAPPIPELGIPVQQQDGCSAFRTGLHNMQADAIGMYITMFQFHAEYLPDSIQPVRTRADVPKDPFDKRSSVSGLSCSFN